MADQGDRAGLRQELCAGNTDTANTLISLYADGDAKRRRDLEKCGLDAAGYP